MKLNGRRKVQIAAAVVFAFPLCMGLLVSIFDPQSNAVGVILLIPICAIIALGVFVGSFFVRK